jgi:hypothetical protein
MVDLGGASRNFSRCSGGRIPASHGVLLGARWRLVSALAVLLAVGPAYAGDLCKANSFTKSQAEQGKLEYNSSCGLCHLYNLKGRVPGEYQNETPDIRILNDNYIKTLDDNGGGTPPLVDQKFLSKWKDQKAFVDRISTAIMGFPPKNYVKFDSDMRIAAYILYKNCGKLGERSARVPHAQPRAAPVMALTGTTAVCHTRR